ncbi:cytochrome-c oxidase, cbb3-type subunit III [Roseovarius nanhaiticus]|uniref:Cbb3-type cytochrome c oxidase subunit n=1 Tax=Roseovarius nanhaiticus TaxID=573024 RepID=A0A1N7HBE6_9RHOB|nr:cytochrome-c oxidase, cbb3-type subunit III [Roseovarius nanhaiticus]SEL04575.1 cytochrome c oxidase cbb3-type subunit 3 [Roseovarius nanhaiticus]SIS22204.1 cytochrome c oxidase cbb3-type subunit 3 [Roseovarius nanhaiticus]
MSDDPRRNAEGSNEVDPHTGHREVDPVTGYDTTGHDWNGIRELNTPFPKIAIWALALSFVYSVIAWILLPAWPLGQDYTRGLLGLDQGDMAVERYRAISAERADWLARFEGGDFAALKSDDTLMLPAMAAANRLYQDNCAACHGAEGGGGPGFPVLNDGHWLWGGDPATIAEILHVGINGAGADARFAQMPSFDWMERGELGALADYVAALPGEGADPDSTGAELFADNCSSCHGENGEGGLMIGAPSLTDEAVIYGQGRASVLNTLRSGRQGVMPAWSDRLSDAEINLLALYVSTLSDDISEAQE